MGLFSGKYENDRDASKANTISDREYRALQARAAKANPDRGRISSKGADDAKRGAENYHKRWWN